MVKLKKRINLTNKRIKIKLKEIIYHKLRLNNKIIKSQE